MATQTAAGEARVLQYAIASVFIVLGGWCLLAPESVIALSVRAESQRFDPLTLVVVGAFGAQAVLAGLFVASSIFTRWTFLAYGVALTPFLVFDWWFFAIVPLFNEWILVDAVGNALMLVLCARGYLLLRRTS